MEKKRQYECGIKKADLTRWTFWAGGATPGTPGCIWGVLSGEGYLHFSPASQWQGHNFLSRLAQFDVSLDWNVILVLPKSIAETLDFGSVIFFFFITNSHFAWKEWPAKDLLLNTNGPSSGIHWLGNTLCKRKRNEAEKFSGAICSWGKSIRMYVGVY